MMERNSRGREFQSLGPATAKARSPHCLHLTKGSIQTKESEVHGRCIKNPLFCKGQPMRFDLDGLSQGRYVTYALRKTIQVETSDKRFEYICRVLQILKPE